MHSSPKVDGAVGLEAIPRTDGTYRLLWRAPKAGQKDGYQPKSVPIALDINDPADHPGIRAACEREQARYFEWRGAKANPVRVVTTVKDLSRLYQTHEASPFIQVKDNTMVTYLGELRLIERTVGDRTLASIKATDFRRWFDTARDSIEGGALRKAQGFIKRFRAIVSFGVMVEIPACARIKAILDEMRFEQPARRESAITYEMVKAIIAKAHELGRPSIALAQALQFETSLRQADVVGLWARSPNGEGSLYGVKGKRWKGLLWQDISSEMILSIKTSKTGATAGYDLAAMPLVKAEIDRIPKEKRIGPVIINETTGRPYLSLVFSRNWRKIADKAGVPSTIWNRDSRAGAISEGDEAGATMSDLQRMATHTTSKMTCRYIRGEAIETSRKVAHLRDASRNKKGP